MEYQTGFALHQMKRDPLFRKVIAPPVWSKNPIDTNRAR